MFVVYAHSSELYSYINDILQEEFEDTNQKHNDQKKKYKRTNNDQQNIQIKLKI